MGRHVQEDIVQGAVLCKEAAFRMGDTVMRSVRYAVERSRLLRIEQAGHVAARAAEQRIRDLLESVDAILWEMDFSTWTYSFVSKRAEDILGYPVSEWLDTPGFLLTHLHPDDRDRLLADGQERVAGSAQSFEVRFFAADGRGVWLLGSVMHGMRDTGESAGMLVDITARKMLELLEREQSEILAMVAQSLPVDSVLARVATLVENQCPGSCVCAVTFEEGLLAWRVGPSVPASFLAGLNRSCFPTVMTPRPTSGARVDDDAWQPCRELAQGFGLALADCLPMLSAQGELRGALPVCRETGEASPTLNPGLVNTAGRLAELLLAHATLELQLSHQANHDALTGLPNRALFNDRLEQSLYGARTPWRAWASCCSIRWRHRSSCKATRSTSAPASASASTPTMPPSPPCCRRTPMPRCTRPRPPAAIASAATRPNSTSN